MAQTGVEPAKRDSLVIAAKLTATQDAEWARGQIGTRWGSHLPNGHRLELLSGLAEITYLNGTTVLLEGPANYTICSPRAGSLASGKLTATVSPQGVGFEIAVPSARVIDLGTSFGLLVDNLGRSHALSSCPT